MTLFKYCWLDGKSDIQKQSFTANSKGQLTTRPRNVFTTLYYVSLNWPNNFSWLYVNVWTCQCVCARAYVYCCKAHVFVVMWACIWLSMHRHVNDYVIIKEWPHLHSFSNAVSARLNLVCCWARHCPFKYIFRLCVNVI